MIRSATLIFLSLVLAVHASAAQTGSGTPVITVRRARVIAFFLGVSQKDLVNNDENETLGDFQFYAGSVRARLKEAGIDFDEVYAKSFRVRTGAKTTWFHPSEQTVGYYLVAPGKKPRIEYGVMTDSDLLQVAKEYFRAN